LAAGGVAGQVRASQDAQGYRSVFLDFDPPNGIPAGRNWATRIARFPAAETREAQRAASAIGQYIDVFVARTNADIDTAFSALAD
jgi:ABC-type uncharacterized transport system substrate-binding protein